MSVTFSIVSLPRSGRFEFPCGLSESIMKRFEVINDEERFVRHLLDCPDPQLEPVDDRTWRISGDAGLGSELSLSREMSPEQARALNPFENPGLQAGLDGAWDEFQQALSELSLKGLTLRGVRPADMLAVYRHLRQEFPDLVVFDDFRSVLWDEASFSRQVAAWNE